VSDRGTHFTADVIRELMVLVAPKQENAVFKNANKRSQDYLRSMLFDNRILKRWSDVLPLVQHIMMAEPNKVIDVSPAQLLFGNSIQLDHGIFPPNLPKEGMEAEITLSDWADKMFEAQRVLLDTAQRLQQQKDARHREATTGVTTSYTL
jgi:hypothetical protein